MEIKRYGEYMSESFDLDKHSLDIQLLDASKDDDVNKVKELLDIGADIDMKDTDDTTVLIGASKYGNTETVKVLLDEGAKIDAIDDGGMTSLSWASINGYSETVGLLLYHGADIETKNKHGLTPLIHSSSQGHEGTVKMLLEYGANINVYDNNGRSCLDYPFSKKIWEKEYIQELIITGQPINIKFFDDKIGILPSLKNKYKEVIEMSELGIFG